MKNPSLRTISRFFALLVIFVLLMSSCTAGAPSAESSGSLRAWIDQPVTNFTLPLAPYTIKAHARQDGGGVTTIQFIVNDVMLGSVPTNSAEELTNASFDWNPSAPGWYRIQAVALNGAGQRALSEVSRICISQGASGDCGEVASTGEKTPGEVDSAIKVGGAPNPVSIGASCNPADRIVTFEAYVPDTGGAIEVDIHGYLVGASGERSEFVFALSPGATPGSYIGTYDLGTLYDGVLAGADGTLEFVLALMNESKEWFKTSAQQTLTVRYCGGDKQVQGMIKVGGVPNPVFIGKCTPTTIDFEAGTDIDPAMFDHIDLAYVWFDTANTWIGTVGEENRAEMTPSTSGGHWYHLDVNTAPAAMSGGGTIKFRAIVVSTDAADVAYSDVNVIVITPCGVTPPQPGITPNVPPTCTSYTKNPDGCKNAGCYYWSDATCNQYPESAPQPPASCASYTGKSSACKNAGCYSWSDGTCSESPEPAAPTCASYTGKPSACKNAGCYSWSDGTCSEYPEPAPPTCADYTGRPNKCKNAGCYSWSDGTCSESPEPAAPACKDYGTQKECETYGCTWDDKQQICY